MSQHTLDDLIRPMNPKAFSESVHGGGTHVCITKGKATLPDTRLLSRWLGAAPDAHYFVKRRSAPMQESRWTFRWSAGTNAVDLDFSARFVLQANEDVQALHLVQALHGPEEVGEALYGLINAALHDEVSAMLVQCNRNQSSLLDCFRRSSAGIGESEALDQAVTRRVGERLGGVVFGIGFQLTNAPPTQVEVQQSDDFTLAGSKMVPKAASTALLQLANYQAYKKSGLASEREVRDTIARAISAAVKQLLFGQSYHDVVRGCLLPQGSISERIKQLIEPQAESIGFTVKSFTTFPTIAALRLKDPLRIDVSEHDEKYMLADGAGHVRVAIAVSVRIAPDPDKLHRLIKPEAVDVEPPIKDRIRQICRDTIQRFSHMDFNLEFESKIQPALTQALVAGLAEGSLVAEGIHVRQAPTEDARRFQALRGRTIPFSALIPCHADGSLDDPMPVKGVIKVTGMAHGYWAKFESVDLGYRDDSQRPSWSMRELARERSVPLPEGEDWSPEVRRNLAIELEFADIRHHVVTALTVALSVGNNLRGVWSTWAGSQQIHAKAQQVAMEAIRNDFGLQIELQAFQRLDTEMDVTHQTLRRIDHEQARKAHEERAQDGRVREQAERLAFAENQVAAIKTLGTLDREAIENAEHPLHAEARQRALALGEASPPSQGSSDQALARLNRPAQRDTQATQPWQAPGTLDQLGHAGHTAAPLLDAPSAARPTGPRPDQPGASGNPG